MTDEYDIEPILISDAIAELANEWFEAADPPDPHRLLFDAGFPEPEDPR